MTNNKNSIIVGCDPGQKGAFTKLDPNNYTIEILDMPVFTIKPGAKTKTVVDITGVGIILNDPRIFQLYIEDVNAMPHDGPVQAHQFGKNVGIVLGACGGLKIPLNQIRAAAWKSALKVPADKDAARFRASQLFPSCAVAWKRKMDDGRAESALIAFYGFCALGYKLEQQFKLIGDLAEND